MQKRGLKFFILHTLSRQLQSWAELISRQIDDEDSIRLTLAKNESSKTENAAHAFPENSALEQATQESMRKDLGSADTETLPAHWLARVQKDAPEFLKQMKYSRPNNSRPPSSLPAAHPNTSRQTEVSGQRPQTIESGQFEKDERPDQPNLAGSKRVESEPSPGASQKTITPMPIIHAPESQEVEDANAANPPVHWQERVGDSELPAPWPESVQKISSEHLEQIEHIHLDAVGHSHILSKAQAASSTEREAGGHRPAITRIISVAQELSAPPEISKQHDREVKEQREQAIASVSTHFMEKRNAETRTQHESEPVQTDEANSHSVPPSDVWSDTWLKADSSAWVEERETSASSQLSDNAWLQGSYAAQAHAHLLPGKASEQIQEMPWPALPDEVAAESRDWEMMRRLWERQRRLDDEQRGNLWNV